MIIVAAASLDLLSRSLPACLNRGGKKQWGAETHAEI